MRKRSKTMPESRPRTGPRGEPERVYERSADPAEAVNRPVEPKSRPRRLAEADEPGAGGEAPPLESPHNQLRNPVREPDPTADSDPYTLPAPDDDADRASGTRGVHQGVEDR